MNGGVRMATWGGPLDRYVFTEFWKILVATALGFQLLLVIIDLTDNLDKFLARNLGADPIVELTTIVQLAERRYLARKYPRASNAPVLAVAVLRV